jgi:hypothetical protein
MITYFGFPVVIVAFSIWVGSHYKWDAVNFLGVWAAASFLLGILGLFVPWHTASGTHRGSGSPVPIGFWERTANGSSIDFPFPLAIIVNPIAIFIIGALSFCVALIARRLFIKNAGISA